MLVALLLSYPRVPPPTGACAVVAAVGARHLRMSLSFEDAVSSAPELCTALQQDEEPRELQPFVSTSAGARGFFVNWLTDDAYTRADAESPPAALAEALVEAPQEVCDVMLMNVVMSAATAVAHQRAGREDQAAMAERTCTRAQLLVRALRPRQPLLNVGVLALQAVLSEEDGKAEVADAAARDSWLVFLQRWMYDNEQLDRVSEALALCGD